MIFTFLRAVDAGLRVADWVLAALPPPDPELRRQRAGHRYKRRQERMRLRQERMRLRQEQWKAQHAAPAGPSTTLPSYVSAIRDLGACEVACLWLQRCNYPTLADAWRACPRGDWLLWLLAGQRGGSPRVLAQAACDCAALALAGLPPQETAPRQALEATWAWIRGEGTLKQVAKAAEDAAGSKAARLRQSANPFYVSRRASRAKQSLLPRSPTQRTREAVICVAYTALYPGSYPAAVTAAAVVTHTVAALHLGAGIPLRVAHLQCADIVRSYFPSPPNIGGSR